MKLKGKWRDTTGRKSPVITGLFKDLSRSRQRNGSKKASHRKAASIRCFCGDFFADKNSLPQKRGRLFTAYDKQGEK